MRKDYIEFVLQKRKHKTDIWIIKNKVEGCSVGKIKWYGAWRQYCFEPFRDTVFSGGCLLEIQEFLARENDAWRERKKK